MLVLTRMEGQRIFIGDEIELLILSVKGKNVRIGISAPKSVQVHRHEIYHRIKMEEALKNGECYYER